MNIEKSEGNYTVEQMQQMATVAQTADGLEISGNNFKVTALTGCPDMVLFACERIKQLENEHKKLRIQLVKYNSDDFEYNDGSEHMGYTVDDLLDEIKPITNK